MYKSAMMFENYQKCLPYFLLFVYISCTYFSCLFALMFGYQIQIIVVICDFFYDLQILYVAAFNFRGVDGPWKVHTTHSLAVFITQTFTKTF